MVDDSLLDNSIVRTDAHRTMLFLGSCRRQSWLILCHFNLALGRSSFRRWRLRQSQHYDSASRSRHLLESNSKSDIRTFAIPVDRVQPSIESQHDRLLRYNSNSRGESLSERRIESGGNRSESHSSRKGWNQYSLQCSLRSGKYRWFVRSFVVTRSRLSSRRPCEEKKNITPHSTVAD